MFVWFVCLCNSVVDFYSFLLLSLFAMFGCFCLVVCFAYGFLLGWFVVNDCLLVLC